MTWLAADRGEYDLIFIDPPTFSNSKRMDDVFDVQRDHVQLLDMAMARLAPGGVLYFSNNFRRFRLDAGLEERYRVEDISAQTLDRDFQRNARIHRTWRIERLGEQSAGGRARVARLSPRGRGSYNESLGRFLWEPRPRGDRRAEPARGLAPRLSGCPPRRWVRGGRRR